MSILPRPPAYKGSLNVICCLPRCGDRCDHAVCSTCQTLMAKDKEKMDQNVQVQVSKEEDSKKRKDVREYGICRLSRIGLYV